MSDGELERQIREVFGAVRGKAPPPFAAAWAAAEKRHRRERRRYATFSGIAASLAIVVTAILSLNEPQKEDEFLIADAFLNRTQWTAPSDVLLPRHQYDVYRDVPFLVEPSNDDEGSLL